MMVYFCYCTYNGPVKCVSFFLMKLEASGEFAAIPILLSLLLSEILMVHRQQVILSIKLHTE